jgi:hypothetical protein
MAKRETVITKEIAILEKTLAKAPEKVKIKIRAKIARLKKEAKGIPMTAKQLANNVLRQKQKIKQLSKTDFNSLIRQLSKKPEYSFLKSMTKDEIVRDLARKAKPVGWRYKGKGDYRNPTKRDIANRKSTGVYWEARRDRSDVSQAAQLEKGGKIIHVKNDYNHNGKFMLTYGDEIIEDNFNSWKEAKTWAIKKGYLVGKDEFEKGGKVTPLKVKSIRYFETNRGTGYQAKTNIPGVEIVNDGTGGATYVKGMYAKTKPYEDLRERELENLLDQFEGIKAKGGKMEQGYNDRMDESLGMRHRGPKSQSHKDRRDEAKGMNKAMGDRAYQSVGTMDKMDKGGYIRIKEILGEDTPWLGTVEDDTPYEEKDGLRYVWYDGDQTTSNVTQVLKRFGLDKQKINDDIKRKGLKKRWVFDDGFAHLTVMFPDKKENGGEIEIEEPQIVRYYFEDDAFEYKKGGRVKSEELEILKKLLVEDIAFEKALLKELTRKGERDDAIQTRGMMGARKEVLDDIRNIEEGNYKKGGTYFAKGGKLKSIPADNKGLPKLPKSVRNKMGYMADGGKMEQGYDDREDESLGMRTGRESSKKQGMKARRDDSYGKFGKRDMEDRGISLKRGGKSDDWIQKVTESDNFKKGAFRAQAKRAGMSTEDFAKKVLSNPSKYSKLTRERASLAKTLMGFKK